MTPEMMQGIRRAADIVQSINLALALALVVVLLMAGWHWPRWRRVLTLPLVYGVLAVGFYVATLANAIPAPMTSLLSASLRLYAHVLIIIVVGVAVVSALLEDGDDEDGGGD